MGNWIYKILGGVVTLVISISLLPVLQDSITPLTTTGGVYEGTAVGTLLGIIPMVLVVVFVLMAVTLIPKRNESL
jgi:uncharacterized membrane protein